MPSKGFITVPKIKVSCMTCGKNRFVYQCVLNQGYGKFCNRSCSAKFYVGRLHTQAVRNKISKSNMGRKLSEEHKRKFLEGRSKIAPWNKGLTAKGDQRIKYSVDKAHEAIRGKPAWNKGISNIYAKGEKSHLWKGGITPINSKIRHSLEYTIWRRSVFERDKYTCQVCNKRGIYLQADHIKPFAYYPKLRFDINNGKTLCKDCHYIKTWNIDVKYRYPSQVPQQ